MDYFGILQKAIKFAWEHKYLWVLGFILALFMGGNSFSTNYSSFNNNTRTTTTSSTLNNTAFNNNINQVTSSINDFMKRSDIVAIFFIILCAVLIIGLIGWYLTSVAKGGIIYATVESLKNVEIDLGKAWNYGVKNAFRYIVVDLYKLPFVILSLIPLVVGTVLIIVIGSALTVNSQANNVMALAFLLTCCFGLFIFFYIIVFIILWGLINVGTDRIIVLKNLGPWETIMAAVALANKYWTNYILAWLVGLLPGCAWVILTFIISLVVLVPAALIAFAALTAGPLAFILTIVIFVIVFFFFSAILNAPFMVFSYSYWTMIVKELMDQK